MDATGTHMLMELGGCHPRLLDDTEFLRELCEVAAQEAGCTVLGVHTHRFEPLGVSVVVVLAESHLSLHTWPELMHASVDCYTCGDHDPGVATAWIAQELQAQDVKILWLERGAGKNALGVLPKPV